VTRYLPSSIIALLASFSVLTFSFVHFSSPIPAHAATTTWSGTLSDTTAFVNLTSCGVPTVHRHYDVYAFYVDTADTYTLSLTSASGMPGTSDDAAMALFSPDYDPSNFQANCLAVSDDAVGFLPQITYTLSADVQYYLVVFNTVSGDAAGATYTGEINGSGTISNGPIDPTVPDDVEVSCDDRVNNLVSDCIAAPFAIYYTPAYGLRIYGINPATSNGVLLIVMSAEEMEDTALPTQSWARFVTRATNPATSFPVTVYRLESGEWQVNGFYHTGKAYAFAWDVETNVKRWIAR
jgi:hypothetical protein